MFGIANNVRSEVRECTPDLLNQALDSPQVAKTCAEIEDALEKHRRGELTQDEYETIKSILKKKLPICTFHAMFKHGKRRNDDAIEGQEVAGTGTKKPGPRNLLDLLPTVFTCEEAQQMRQRQGIVRGSAKMMLDNWKKRGYIQPYGDKQEDINLQQYTKTEAYLKEHPQVVPVDSQIVG